MFLTVKAVKKRAACSCAVLETHCLTCSFFSHVITSMARSSLSKQLQIPLSEDLLHLSLLHVQALKAKHKDEGGIKTNVTVLMCFWQAITYTRYSPCDVYVSVHITVLLRNHIPENLTSTRRTVPSCISLPHQPSDPTPASDHTKHLTCDCCPVNYYILSQLYKQSGTTGKVQCFHNACVLTQSL